MPRLHATGAEVISGSMEAVQPVAGFRHHAPRAAQVVAFGLSPGPVSRTNAPARPRGCVAEPTADHHTTHRTERNRP
jgi:hypothetical protein